MSVVTIKQAADALGAMGVDVFNNQFIAVDPEFHSLFLSTGSDGNRAGDEAQMQVYQALQVSEPLLRAIGHTTSMSGTKSWYEKGLDYSWHYHPEIGLNLSVLTSRS